MATEKDMIDCMASYQWDRLNEQLAAKDREIAEAGTKIGDMANTIIRLTAELNEARNALGELLMPKASAWDPLAAGLPTIEISVGGYDSLIRERDEARECVGRLFAAGDDVGSWLSAALSDDSACAEFKASCEKMLAALAATPEHLRK